MEWTNTSPIISKLTDMIKKKWTRFGSQKNKTTARGGFVADTSRYRKNKTTSYIVAYNISKDIESMSVN